MALVEHRALCSVSLVFGGTHGVLQQPCLGLLGAELLGFLHGGD